MTGTIKKLLFRTVGLNTYLRLLHKGFHYLFITGSLRKNYVYKYHYFVKHLVQPDDIVLDIGANLGYYTRIFSDLLSPQGKVIAVEPVSPFYKVIVKEVGKRKNVTVHNYALGVEDKNITLTIPDSYGYIRTGLPQINENTVAPEDAYVFEGRMTKASSLFATLPKIDFVKCDIEGYEEYVIPEMLALLKKHQPLILIETWGEHRERTFKSLTEAGFIPYVLYKGKLTGRLENVTESGDFLFLHKDKEAKILAPLRQKGFL